jgi:hypothetical protein
VIEAAANQRSNPEDSDPNKDYVVCTDACKEGLGGVLSQEGFVIFMSPES